MNYNKLKLSKDSVNLISQFQQEVTNVDTHNDMENFNFNFINVNDDIVDYNDLIRLVKFINKNESDLSDKMGISG